jgi:C-terminal processing protease CtpA/Prc
LAAEGLKAGMNILEVDGKPVEELDEWEVDRRLTGVHGDKVILKWKTGPKTDKMAPFLLK